MRSLTTGVVMLGVHMVTVPLAWPSAITAFHGFCRMTLHGPSRVRWLHTICPVVVSYRDAGGAQGELSAAASRSPEGAAAGKM